MSEQGTHTIINIPETPNSGAGQQTVVVVNPGGSSIPLGAGELSLVFGIISIFVLAIVFVPLGLISGIIAIRKEQVWKGITGIILSLVGIMFSPTFWGIITVFTKR